MSITPSERKALLFLTSLLTLGALARFVNAARYERRLSAVNSAPLAAQIAAVDSARARDRAAIRSRPKAPRAGAPQRTRRMTRANADSVIVVDVDRATAAELDLLPRVGPALAQRIISNREEFGPFGSLAALARVKGIGPKLVTRLAAHVTFSGSVRPSTALSVSPGSAPNSGRSPPPG
ncbi:MAG: ComEA family DNA-binding protein [Gemmatimonadaceae bacterium]